MPDSAFTPSVWSKIYQSDILKHTVEKIAEPLLFAEDCYLNSYAFFEEGVKNVSVRPEAYYVWNVGVGFSASNNSEEILFNELRFIKPLQLGMLEKYSCNDEIAYLCHLEVLYFMKAMINHMIEEKKHKKDIERKIKELSEYDIVKEAKLYFRAQMVKKNWKELEFMISDYSPTNYYDWCLQQKPSRNLKNTVKKLIKICKH